MRSNASKSGAAKSGAVNSGKAMDREATAQALERAALTLIERNGVLAGLNLREVADVAGVNRGLVYHYFGTRHDLLRSALRRNVRQQFGTIRAVDEPSRFGDRWRHAMSGISRYASKVRLLTLLLLDGDTKLDVVPDLDRTQQLLAQDRAVGLIPEDADPIALHTVILAQSYGYALLRAHLAAEFRIGVRELDRRVAELVERLGNGLTDRD